MTLSQAIEEVYPAETVRDRAQAHMRAHNLSFCFLESTGQLMVNDDIQSYD